MFVAQTSELLSLLGMSPKGKGYYFVRCAVENILTYPYQPKILTIYRFVAKNYSTNVPCVERNIRYAIERTWECGNLKNIYLIFGYTVSPEKGKPTNSEFLFMLAERIKMNTKKDA